MKKLFKALAAIAALVLAGSMFTACVNDDDDDDEPSKYTITYQTAQAAASKPDSKTVTAGYKLTEADLPTLSADGYAFGGWHNGSESGEAVSAGFAVNKDLTLVAGWTEIPANSVVVTFNANTPAGAELTGTMAQQTVTKATETALTANAFAVAGYRFTVWNTAADGSGTAYENAAFVTLTANLVLYAQWKAVFTVTFNVNGGTGEFAAQEIESGATATAPATKPNRAHYNFDGWFTSSDGGTTFAASAFSFDAAITANVTLYAKWTEITHTVTLNIGTPDNTVDTVKFADGVDTTNAAVGEETGWQLPSFATLGIAEVWNDHVPFGWSATKQEVSADAVPEIGGDGATIHPTADVEIYVVWKEGSAAYYTVKYEYEDVDGKYSEDSDKTEELTATLNESIEIEPSEASRKGNYDVPASQTQTFTQKTGNTVTFKYALVKHSVSFEANGGSGTFATQNVRHGATATEPVTAPTKEDYVFDGWYSNNAAFDFATEITEDVALTAHFTEITLTITSPASGAVIAAAEDSLTLTEAHTPTGDDYTVEWSVPDNSCVTVADGTLTRTDAGITADATVTVTATLKNGNTTLKTATTGVTVKANKFTIAHATGISNGSISTSAADSTAKVGEEVTITAQPATGFELGTIIVTAADGTAVTVSDGNKFTMPDSNVTITATFTAISYDITVGTLEHGSVTVNPTNAHSGDTVTVTVTPDTGYKLKADSLTQNGTKITQTEAGSYTFTMGAAAVSVTAEFEPETYSITYNVDNSTATSLTPATYTYGTAVTLPTPTKTGYVFDGWYTASNGGDKVESITATDTGNKTLYAHWTKITLTVSVGGEALTGDNLTATLAAAAESIEFTAASTPTGGDYSVTFEVSGDNASSVSFTQGSGADAGKWTLARAEGAENADDGISVTVTATLKNGNTTLETAVVTVTVEKATETQTSGV